MSLLSFVHPFRFIGKSVIRSYRHFSLTEILMDFHSRFLGEDERSGKSEPANDKPANDILRFYSSSSQLPASLNIVVRLPTPLFSSCKNLYKWLAVPGFRAEKSLFCLLLPNIGIYWNLLIMNNDIILHHFRLDSKLTFRR